VRKFNPQNERIKRRYFDFLADAKQLSTDTVDQVAAALSDFEASTGFREFRLFRIEQAQSYKRKLAQLINPKTGRPLAKATISARLAALKAFFQWLSREPGFKSRLRYSDAEYFNPSAKDDRIAKAPREKRVPTIEQIQHTLASMPAESDVERRDRAVLAFTLLSGARDNAIASMSLKHVDLARRRVNQDPREGVKTKNAKTITSVFFPVGEDIEAIVTEWIQHLRADLLRGPHDPLFPATKTEVGESGHFENTGLSQKHWADAAAIRRIFKDAFHHAGLPYFNPHSFRSTLALLADKKCRNAEDLKAWSQNLGHTHVLTTLTSYGAVAQHRQDQIFLELANHDNGPAEMVALPDQLDRIERMLAELRDNEGGVVSSRYRDVGGPGNG
jgi:integrase